MFELILPTNKMPPKTPLNQTDPIRTKKNCKISASAPADNRNNSKCISPSARPRNPIIVGKTANYIEHGFIFYLQLIIFAPSLATPCSASRFVHGGWNTSRLLYGVVWQQPLPRSKDPQHVNHAAWSSASHFFFVHAGHRGIREF